ncbi:PREDICTED: phosphatidylcholine:diacylglycerol cholinephosphotransferase 1-like [Ipomoea nil]|uniref:phosphatidylcholine:diacylglycerol cholinephosphotransferase 1-like n=1 Tax=Ipomoea nil TaxID=35883 RepID=UPI000901C284|nr:PREDICTED: phosphatidylcholine:diacylglycerol cholinephosphotransferase 1-like [Ipomoea nil]XP_019168795.1 PREDICTED: phosphatidylcholine:diacylglycerol cholinephosphotransferase 1-like [Ipomoea nil]
MAPSSYMNSEHVNAVSQSTVWAGMRRPPVFMEWRARDVFGVVKRHPIPCFFFVAVFVFMHVEFSHRMILSDSPPLDFGFLATAPLNRMLASHPNINHLLAAINTVFMAVLLLYIICAWVIEGRPRAAISTVFMFTCRGILGCLTQLPVPQDFLASEVDFPVGNTSFFLFFSGHVATFVIAAQDMQRVKRPRLAFTFHVLNLFQIVRLLSTRGHYTIDMAAGFAAGFLFDYLAGNYEEYKKKQFFDDLPRTVVANLNQGSTAKST